MDEISRRRADKAGDNRLWSPQDALEDAANRLKDVDPKKVHLVIVWREELDDQTSQIRWNSANCQRHDQISILELMKFELCKDWLNA